MYAVDMHACISPACGRYYKREEPVITQQSQITHCHGLLIYIIIPGFSATMKYLPVVAASTLLLLLLLSAEPGNARSSGWRPDTDHARPANEPGDIRSSGWPLDTEPPRPANEPGNIRSSGWPLDTEPARLADDHHNKKRCDQCMWHNGCLCYCGRVCPGEDRTYDGNGKCNKCLDRWCHGQCKKECKGED